jgi:hypothetical protein
MLSAAVTGVLPTVTDVGFTVHPISAVLEIPLQLKFTVPE